MAFLKNIWKTNSKHKKLPEELALQNPKDVEPETESGVEAAPADENETLTFKLKYLGSTVVEKVSGENISVEAVKNILKVTKASRKKLERVNLNVSLKGIAVNDLQGTEVFKVSIYRISNCSTDASHKQVFSFISTDADENTECHAFLCSKRKLAETVTLAIAHAFSTAYEAWRILPMTKQFENTVENSAKNPVENEPKIAPNKPAVENSDMIDMSDVTEEKLIDFDEDEDGFNSQLNHKWVSFDDDFAQDAPLCNPWSSPKQVDLILA